MKKLSHLTRISLLLTIFFGLDKGLAILRQVVIARQFGLSTELDAFNAANNLPDMLYAMISGGALAIALIPVLSETITQHGRPAAWSLFARIANLSFIVTAGFAVIIAILARSLVGWQFGIAPGFGSSQQQLVAELMRLNLAATLIFSISGLVMAGLQANQHFLLPAMAPLLYNLGQIVGALILSPTKNITLGPVTLPAFGLGVHGLVYGVIIGAVLHLLVQVPGLIKYKFQWAPRIDLHSPEVVQVLRLLGPRVITVLFIQLIFMVRDNLASRLGAGPVSALTYGWMIMQVPETLIGTAIGTAMLPTLAEQIARNDWLSFKATVERAGRVMIALTIPIAAVLAFGLGPLVRLVFGFDAAGTQLVMWASIAYLAGLLGHSLMEVAARAFYAQQDARIPLLTSGLTMVLFIGLGLILMPTLGAAGIALANSLAYTVEAIILFSILNRRMPSFLDFGQTLLRSILAGAVAGALVWALTTFMPARIPASLLAVTSMAVGGLVSLPVIWKEIRLLMQL